MEFINFYLLLLAERRSLSNVVWANLPAFLLGFFVHFFERAAAEANDTVEHFFDPVWMLSKGPDCDKKNELKRYLKQSKSIRINN